MLCPNCGLELAVPEDWTRPKIRCRECGTIADIKPPVRPQSPPRKPGKARKPHTPAWELPPQELRVPRPPSDVVPQSALPAGAPSPSYAEVYLWSAEDDNSDPYGVADPDRPRCAHCETILEVGTVLCVRCGFDQRERRKRAQEFSVMVHRWDAGMSASRRFGWFFAGQLLTVSLGLTGSVLLGELGPFLFSWLLFSGLTAFLLGTWDRIDLTRSRKGHVELSKTWHICFFPTRPTAIDLRLYEGISTSQDHEAGFFEWLVFLGLLPYLIPAFLWWWVAIRQDTVQVALTRDHGSVAMILYRGWNQEQAQEIAHAVADAAHLPRRLG